MDQTEIAAQIRSIADDVRDGRLTAWSAMRLKLLANLIERHLRPGVIERMSERCDEWRKLNPASPEGDE